jgi:hypothetical protein
LFRDFYHNPCPINRHSAVRSLNSSGGYHKDIKIKLAIGLIGFLIIHSNFGLSNAQSLPAACANANSRFITGPEFLNNSSMTLQQIRQYLQDVNSWLTGTNGMVLDTDNQYFDFAQAVFDAAAHPNKGQTPPVSPKPINPQLILTMIQKESSVLFRYTRPVLINDERLTLLTGCGAESNMRSQIQCAARSLRNRFDDLATCQGTAQKPSWNLNGEIIPGLPIPCDPSTKDKNCTQDKLAVTPTNASTMAQFAYNPVAGLRWEGQTKKGGVALFCELWHRDMKKNTGIDFAKPPTNLTPAGANPTLTCGDPLKDANGRDRKNVTLSVVGGTPPYTWSPPTKGTLSVCGPNQEDAVLTPPPNPGPKVDGNAYSLWSFTYANAWPWVHIYQWKDAYGCDDDWRHTSNTETCSCGVLNCPDKSWQSPPQFADSLLFCGDKNVTTCSGHSLPQVQCTGNRLIDGKNGQFFKEGANCNPCGISMQGGAALTVQDSTGAKIPVSITVNVP